MQILKVLLAAASLAASTTTAAAAVDYAGYKVYRVETADRASVEAQLRPLSATNLYHTGSHVDVLVPPGSVPRFEALDLNSTVLNGDLGADLRSEGDLVAYNRVATTAAPDGVAAAALPDDAWFDAYHAYEDHLSFLADLAAASAGHAETFEAGPSFEGRPLTGIRLWGGAGKGSKPAVYFNGNVHAREWITSMVCEYLAYQLAAGYGSDEEVTKILDEYEFYIIPIVNPDGFVYTQTTDRMWRKNRQTRPSSSPEEVGTDVNRNWPYKWEGEGSSPDPADETYRGEEAGDAPENLALRNLADQLGSEDRGLKLYIDWHSYSQLVLLPYGWSCEAKLADLDAQMDLAGGYVGAIAASAGTEFEYGPTCRTIYVANGGSNDYVQDVSKAQYAWAQELRDTGRYGFVLPADQIRPSGVESWDGIKYLMANL